MLLKVLTFLIAITVFFIDHSFLLPLVVKYYGRDFAPMLLTTRVEVAPILELLYLGYRRSILQVRLICVVVIIYTWRLLLQLLMTVVYDEHAIAIFKFM